MLWRGPIGGVPLRGGPNYFDEICVGLDPDVLYCQLIRGAHPVVRANPRSKFSDFAGPYSHEAMGPGGHGPLHE